MAIGRRRTVRSLAALGTGVLIAATATCAAQRLATQTAPSLTVDAERGVHAIPDEIYGINWASERVRRDLRVPVNRWGGNETSLYNHEGDVYNTGKDWYFENHVGKDRMRVHSWVAANQSTQTGSLVTVPMLGWVADAAKPEACAFSERKYGAQETSDQWRPDCGNGIADGKRVTGNDPTEFATKVDPATRAGDMVRSLAAQHGSASRGGVRFYELDNEPGLWHETHRSVRPDPVGREDLIRTSRTTAERIKEADPDAAVLGPSDWGYCGWLYAPADGDPDKNCDASSDAEEALTAAYVKAFKAHADTHDGQRLLDYVDQHYYPQGDGVALTTSAGSSETQALRLRSTRSLWDPTYKDESWIGATEHVNAEPLQFIRKLREWAGLYPGTKTAITEYNWGGTESMNGAVAQADVLGIFGREGLDLATYWNHDNAIDGTPVEWAFRIYRNYDGEGGQFGRIGVDAGSTDQGRLAVYAGKGADALTVVVINKTSGALEAPLKVANYPHQLSGRAYTLAPANPRTITEKSVSIGRSGMTHTYPAQSVTLIRINRA